MTLELDSIRVLLFNRGNVHVLLSMAGVVFMRCTVSCRFGSLCSLAYLLESSMAEEALQRRRGSWKETTCQSDICCFELYKYALFALQN